MEPGGLHRSQHRNRFGLGLVLLSGLAIASCKSTQEVQDTHLIWHDGDCLLLVRNMSAEQAQHMLKDISLEKCHVQFTDDLNEGAKK